MANRDDFDWNDPELRVVRNYGDIAVYTNKHGDIAIRQSAYPDDDSVVIVPRQQATWLVAAIEEELKTAFTPEHAPEDRQSGA
jgi:hypothetical protein